jgi:hypothetical protein
VSRSGYNDDGTEWDLIKWRGAVASAVRGKRGQAFLREMLVALDAIPTKQLIDRNLETLNGVCAIGAVGRRRSLNLSKIDPDDRESVAGEFGIAPALAAEIMYENDEAGAYWRHETREERWSRIRDWVASLVVEG